MEISSRGQNDNVRDEGYSRDLGYSKKRMYADGGGVSALLQHSQFLRRMGYQSQLQEQQQKVRANPCNFQGQ